MKSLIFYGSHEKLTRQHIQVSGRGTAGGYKQATYFIRVDTMDGDCVEALDNAKPMEGETVLNTVTINLEIK
jgi:hypothetical protein